MNNYRTNIQSKLKYAVDYLLSSGLTLNTISGMSGIDISDINNIIENNIDKIQSDMVSEDLCHLLKMIARFNRQKMEF